MSRLNLTPLQRHEASLRLYNILMSLPIAKKAGDTDEYLRLERQLSANLIRQWTHEYTKILKTLPEKITEQVIKILNENLEKALGKDFGNSERVKKFFHDYIGKTYKNSKREFAPEANLSLPDKKAVDVLTKHNCFWISEHYGSHIGGKIAELTQQALTDGLGRKELAKELKSALGGKVGGYKYWDVASSAALVRARSFGAISGMEEAGIAEYEILAMQDERMCPICGEMDGRAFSVAITRERINSVLNIKDPEAFKQALPWQSESPKGLSNAALQNSGMNLPPFHGRCRCTLVAVSENFDETVNSLSFPQIKSEEVIYYDENSKIAQVKPHKMPLVGLPNWKYDKLGDADEVVQRRFYDDKGDVELDIDFNDHGTPKAHPMRAHSHDWVNGKRSNPRQFKEWEENMYNDVQTQNKKSIQKSADKNKTSYAVTIGEYKEIMNIGGEFGFIYDGHRYFTSGFDNYSAWEYNNENSYKDGFKDVDDLLSNYHVHTGESLFEVIPKSEVEFCPC